jgi:hypothetical protein
MRRFDGRYRWFACMPGRAPRGYRISPACRAAIAATLPVASAQSGLRALNTTKLIVAVIHVGRKPAAQKNEADDKCYGRKNDRMQSVLDPGVHASLAWGMRSLRPIACPAIFPDFIPSSVVV